MKWTEVCREFYGPFKKNLKEKEASVEKQIEISDVPCPHCGKPMIIKFGRMGKFLACPEPGVKVTLPMPEEAAQIKALEEKTKGELCPICGKPMKVRARPLRILPWLHRLSKLQRHRENLEQDRIQMPELPRIARPPRQARRHRGEKIARPRQTVLCLHALPDCTFVMNKKPESEEELQAALKHWKENPPKPKAAKEKK